MRRNDSQEEILWSGRPSHLSKLGTYFFCVFFMLLTLPFSLLWHGYGISEKFPMLDKVYEGIWWALILTPLFWAFWSWLMVIRHRYEITSERLIEHSGLFRNSEPLELYSVVDYQLPSAYIMAFFGLGDIVLETTDKRQPRVVIRAIRRRQVLYDQIRQQVERLRIEKKGYFER